MMKDKIVMMKCGHAANAVHIGKNGAQDTPCCAICSGIDVRGDEVAETPSLENRKARCTYWGKTIDWKRISCGWNASQNHKFSPRPENASENVCYCETDSDMSLPFFSHDADKKYDEFYCGCLGWD
jgi:hypothetical protein